MKNKQHKTTSSHPERKKLYEAMLYIYNLCNIEDLLFLTSPAFLNLCEVQAIHWNFNTTWLKKSGLEAKKEKTWSFQFSCPLNCKMKTYGELIFCSSRQFSRSKKHHLKKISGFAASTLYFIESKEKMKTIQQQWGGTFDSFSQAFCITDTNFKIVRFNQAFQSIISMEKVNLFGENFFKILPFPVQMPKAYEQEKSWLAKGERKGQKLYWELSFKPLFLKKEKLQTFLFLVKDISEEIEISAKLSAQAKEKEIGLIKGSIAHELNNPIAGVKTMLSVIEKQISPKKTLIKDSLKEMQKAINTCQQIIQHLLFISKNPKRGESSPLAGHKNFL